MVGAAVMAWLDVVVVVVVMDSVLDGLLMLMPLMLSARVVGDAVEVVVEVVVVVVVVEAEEVAVAEVEMIAAAESVASSSKSTTRIGTRHSAMSVMWLRFMSMSMLDTSSKSRCTANTPITSAISAGVGRYLWRCDAVWYRR
jgi:hypothetical protein